MTKLQQRSLVTLQKGKPVFLRQVERLENIALYLLGLLEMVKQQNLLSYSKVRSGRQMRIAT
jgi:hypothetical protein